MTFRQALSTALLIFSAAFDTGCGYGIRRPGTNLLSEKEGIHKIYVAPFNNQSLKPGVENVVFNQVSRVLASSAQIQIVSFEKDADAVLKGVVESASYASAGGAPVQSLKPEKMGEGSFIATRNVATQYAANLSASFILTRRVAVSKTKGPGNIWSGGFSRGKNFQANNQLGMFGTTNALINDSNFDRSLSEIAISMAYDLQESLFSQF